VATGGDGGGRANMNLDLELEHACDVHVIHKVNIYLESNSACPLLVRIETPPPTPSPASKCAPPLNQRGGGGTHSPAAEEVGGGPNSDDWRKSLALSDVILCALLLEMLTWALS
jgi:hypothetical protein